MVTTSPTSTASTHAPRRRHGDLVEPVRTARDRGMRVIADLAVNHTSDRHPWFRSVRASKNSPIPRLLRLALRPAAGHLRPDRVPRPEVVTREYDERSGEYYLVLVFGTARLNVVNPAVRDEIAKTMLFA